MQAGSAACGAQRGAVVAAAQQPAKQTHLYTLPQGLADELVDEQVDLTPPACCALCCIVPQALPIFLDRLANPIAAVMISVTVVLVFGEIIPQAICSRYGLKVGAYSAWFVKALMVVCSPLSWPVGKLLDYVLGSDHGVSSRTPAAAACRLATRPPCACSAGRSCTHCKRHA